MDKKYKLGVVGRPIEHLLSPFIPQDFQGMKTLILSICL